MIRNVAKLPTISPRKHASRCWSSQSHCDNVTISSSTSANRIGTKDDNREYTHSPFIFWPCCCVCVIAASRGDHVTVNRDRGQGANPRKKSHEFIKQNRNDCNKTASFQAAHRRKHCIARGRFRLNMLSGNNIRWYTTRRDGQVKKRLWYLPQKSCRPKKRVSEKETGAGFLSSAEYLKRQRFPDRKTGTKPLWYLIKNRQT